tara:strand:+ start:6420 stop:6821 length:402 start_codon:yes stop_codon:yes gene_type:complete
MSKISAEAREVYGKVYKIWKDSTGTATVGYRGYGKNPADFNLAKRFVNEIWKEIFEKDFPYPIHPLAVTGTRHTWILNGVFYINCDKGWQNINHAIGHLMSYKKYPNKRPHSAENAWLEVRGAELIVKKYLNK